MSYLRFNHVFFGLMALALISAFALPPRIADRVRSPVLGAFTPVSYPSRRIGAFIHDRIFPPIALDIVSPKAPRDIEVVRRENQQLHNQVLNYQAQLNMLIEREDARSRLGDLRNRCTPIVVTGSDTGKRDSLILGGTSFTGLRDGMVALYAGGIVGRLSAVGVGGARVTLITDPSSRVEATFTRAVHNSDGSVSYLEMDIAPKLVTGLGNGVMTATITEDERLKGELRSDDWVVLADGEWPRELRSFRIGYVESIQPTRNPGFLQVTIRPDSDLRMLQEVMVMNKE